MIDIYSPFKNPRKALAAPDLGVSGIKRELSMDNPYWTSEGQRHHLSLESIRLLCFELLCIFEASKPLIEEVEAVELEEGKEIDPSEPVLLKLHHNYAFVQCSKALLQLALLMRTYDDQMKASVKQESYQSHLISIDDGNYVGILNGAKTFRLREACNKIIHAHEIRPLFERLDREVNEKGLEQDLWYLTGEIELQGKWGNAEWTAVIHLQPFLDTVLDSIALGDPS